MDLFQTLDKEAVRELFSKNWLTHDAMWYGLCVQELGPKKANHLNKSAVRLMAGIEITRIKKLIGLSKTDPIENFDELADVIQTAFQLVQTGFLKFDFSFPKKNLLRGRFEECFAHKGVKKFGIIDSYECGIVERVKGWMDGLGVGYEMSPDFKGCLMHQNGKCTIDFLFSLD